MHIKLFLEISSKHPNCYKIFTHGCKVDEEVAAAPVSSVAPKSSLSCRLLYHYSIYTPELQAIFYSLIQAYQCQGSKIFFSRFTLRSASTRKTESLPSPTNKKQQHMLHKIDVDQKEIVFMWVPGHVGFRGNGTVGRPAKKKLIAKKLQTIPCRFQT